jgi:molybdate transport system substrate-binding protein
MFARVLLIVAMCVPLPAQAQTVTVLAAASLTDAFKQVAALWEQAGHRPPRLSFGSSSNLARQIEQGAPANLFASADTQWMDYLDQRGLIAPGTRDDVLGNELVLIVPVAKARDIAIFPDLDIRALLGDDGRIATGDPAHVPVGIYAREAFKKLGLWQKIEPHLARTQDVRAALRFVDLGEAAAGVVYATDAAITKGVSIAGTFPASSHDPIVYPFGIVKSGDTPEARDLLKFLRSDQARAVFQRLGFKVLIAVN